MTQQTDQNYDNWSDWNYVEAIQFSFGKPVGAGKNNATQNLLNAAYSQKLTNINSILTVDNHGAETLKPDAISRIKSLVTAAIIKNLPLSEVSPKCKKHIRMLLEHSTIWYLDKDTTRRPVHDYHALAPTANAASLTIISIKILPSNWNSASNIGGLIKDGIYTNLPRFTIETVKQQLLRNPSL
eukprot:jgi/Psemu1/46929/gm1.46929_g